MKKLKRILTHDLTFLLVGSSIAFAGTTRENQEISPLEQNYTSDKSLSYTDDADSDGYLLDRRVEVIDQYKKQLP